MKQYKYFSQKELQIARENGISYDMLLVRRRDKGWSIKKAITEPTQKYQRNLVTKEQIREAEQHGIPRSVLYGRLIKMKWEYERAISEPVKKKW